MTNKQFFIDTADLEYIKKTWYKLSYCFEGKELRGITTNPHALSKINLTTMNELRNHISLSIKLLNEIRGDTKGLVFVQIPNSRMNYYEISKFINIIEESYGYNKIAIKIPPYYNDVLRTDIAWNVTGLAECATALKCLSDIEIDWVSIIPGRMEEAGINAIEQIQYVNQHGSLYGKIITGSMRTLKGLKEAIQLKTVPTIGTRVLDEVIKDGQSILDFKAMWDYEYSPVKADFAPNIDDRMTQLSKDFFIQMDTLGTSLYQDFLSYK